MFVQIRHNNALVPKLTAHCSRTFHQTLGRHSVTDKSGSTQAEREKKSLGNTDCPCGQRRMSKLDTTTLVPKLTAHCSGTFHQTLWRHSFHSKRRAAKNSSIKARAKSIANTDCPCGQRWMFKHSYESSQLQSLPQNLGRHSFHSREEQQVLKTKSERKVFRW